ncbi:MAG: restriction endonuclease subunit S [Cytophagales bacterium]
MKVLKVKSKWFDESNLRIDAKYHLSEGRVTRATINKSNSKVETLGSVSEKIFYGGRSRRNYVEDPLKGIPFLGSSDMLKSNINDLKYLSLKNTKNLKELILEKNWLLISRSGTIGKTAFTNIDFANKAASEHIIRVIPKKSILPGYLYAYLSSKYGYSLMTQGTFGAVIQHIEPDFLSNLPVPILSKSIQKNIQTLIENSQLNKAEANKFLNSSISLLENYFANSNFKIKHRIEYISFDNINNDFLRFDATYQIAKDKLSSERIKGITYKRIGDFANNIFVNNRAKRQYVSKGVPFLSSSEMMLFDPIRHSKKISKNTKNIKELQVNKGDILISRSGTIGNTIIVGEYLNNVAISEHALRLVIDSKKIPAEYIFCYLKTKRGQMQMKSSAFGSVIITLDESLVSNIEIPIGDDNLVKKITNNIRSYIRKQDQAIDMENQAISIIENEIASWQK